MVLTQYGFIIKKHNESYAFLWRMLLFGDGDYILTAGQFLTSWSSDPRTVSQSKM